MILTMAYLLLIALLLGVGALIGERLCAELDWPRRSAWLMALLVSIALPAYTVALSATTTADQLVVSLPLTLNVFPTIDSPNIAPIGTENVDATPLSWPDWRVFDTFLVVFWAISSVAMLLYLLVAYVVLRRSLSKAQPTRIGDQEVLLTDSLGPAVLGFLRPRVVLPRWLVEQETALRSLVLTHERQHIAARDHLTLFAALLLLALMPWNISLWWQLRRLRTAMELDCDGRVLREGVNAHDYSAALLNVGRRSMATPFPSVALTEPASELEKRIGIMINRAKRLGIAGFGGRAIVFLAVVCLAIAVNAPNAQQPTDGTNDTNAEGSVPTIRIEVFEQLERAQACLDEEGPTCALGILDELAVNQDLNVYETAQLHTFYAFTHDKDGDLEQAVRAFENVLALPRSGIPNGLLQQTIKNLSQLYFASNRSREALALYNQLLESPNHTVSPYDYYLMANMYSQLNEQEDAIRMIEQAIADSAEPKAGYYRLLLNLQNRIDDQEGASSTLEALDTHWPEQQWEVRQEREYLPTFSTPPIYPPVAAAEGIEGYVVVKYTVAQTGTTKDFEVVESSDPIFETSAINSVKQYRYEQRAIDGTPIEVPGVTTKVIFELGDDAD